MAKETIRQVEEVFDKAKLFVKDKLGLFDPVIIYPFRGYGNEHSAYLKGRILEKEHVIHGREEVEHHGLWHNLRKIWKRYESDEVPGVTVAGELYGFTAEAVSDTEGYFTLEFSGLDERNFENGWHDVQLEIKEMPFDLEYEREAVGEILMCDQQNSFGIISDVDDTIIESNATSTIKQLTTMIRHNAETRTMFEGVEDLYHGLVQDFRNPLFFVSGSSFNLYDLLIDFCEHHNIPKAPFFLRDIGLDAKQWIKQDTVPYKLEYIRDILNIYPDLSFVCIGDSGQKDAEIYRQVHRENPGRIKAIYIRQVGADKSNESAENLKEEPDVPFLLIDHSKAAIDHARENGWMK